MRRETTPSSSTPAEQWLARLVGPDAQPTGYVLDWVLVEPVRLLDSRPEGQR